MAMHAWQVVLFSEEITKWGDKLISEEIIASPEKK